MTNTETTTTRNLIVVTTQDDTIDYGDVIIQGGTEEAHAGLATAEQIAASDAAGDTGLIQIDDDGDVIPEGGFHTGTLRTAYVEV